MEKCVKLLICVLIIVMLLPLNGVFAAVEIKHYQQYPEFYSANAEYIKICNYDDKFYRTVEPIEWDIIALTHRIINVGGKNVLEQQTDRVIEKWYTSYLKTYGQYTGTRGVLLSGYYPYNEKAGDGHSYAYMWVQYYYVNRIEKSEKIGWKANKILSSFETSSLKEIKKESKWVLEAWKDTLVYANHQDSEVYKKIEQELTGKMNMEIMDNWLPSSTGSNSGITTIAGKLLGVIQVLGSVISVIALAVIGIKYMLGSVSEKVKYKENMLQYIVGCVMLFAISNIVSVIYKLATNI